MNIAWILTYKQAELTLAAAGLTAFPAPSHPAGHCMH